MLAGKCQIEAGRLRFLQGRLHILGKCDCANDVRVEKSMVILDGGIAGGLARPRHCRRMRRDADRGRASRSEAARAREGVGAL